MIWQKPNADWMDYTLLIDFHTSAEINGRQWLPEQKEKLYKNRNVVSVIMKTVCSFAVKERQCANTLIRSFEADTLFVVFRVFSLFSAVSTHTQTRTLQSVSAFDCVVSVHTLFFIT